MSTTIKLTNFQQETQKLLKQDKSVLLVAPTGLGKTLAVTADLQEKFTKTVYAVPLRALGIGIRDAISKLKRNGTAIEPKVHHGDSQESLLFSEEVVVTTYDQVVCAVPGLPLSLPLRAGHAVAGALLMARLILDEAHLAWGISDQALTILLGIIDFRRKLGLQTVVVTATLPVEVATEIGMALDLEVLILGKGKTDAHVRYLEDDEALSERNTNRQVRVSALKLKLTDNGDKKKPDFSTLDENIFPQVTKRIYFANTVERIQETYDRLISKGVNSDAVTVLHNRMPRAQRADAEAQTTERFGSASPEGEWLLLTNQVAEAGLDISADLVVSDPAPVDTLVQRAGRCARWFRNGVVTGEFKVLDGPNKETRQELAGPYNNNYDFVQAALEALPSDPLTWEVERKWVDGAWGGEPSRALDRVERTMNEIDFALNLFDRAAQQHRPGEIAAVFREVLSVETAVEDTGASQDLQLLVNEGKRPETSSISLGRAWQLVRASKGAAKAIRYDEGEIRMETADYIQLGDVLVIPSSLAYLHPKKGLCFGDAGNAVDAVKSSNWFSPTRPETVRSEGAGRQTLDKHVRGVMCGTHARLSEEGSYTTSLKKILAVLETTNDAEQLARVIAQVATLAAAFHDLGKTDRRWQERARAIDPEFGQGLIGRTARTAKRIGIPHTPPAFLATIKAAELLLGSLDSAEYLVRAIALAAARHHSSLLNPAVVDYKYQAHQDAGSFVRAMLAEVGAPPEAQECSHIILEAAAVRPDRQAVPLLLPNDDLFPVYALVGRAILMADREDASGQPLEQWRGTQP